jgi:endoglucanase
MKTYLLPMLTFMVLTLVACDCHSADPVNDAYHYNRLLGRGVNLGNALEAPDVGQWGLTLKEEYFQKIKEAGFNSVRIPIRWSAHALKEAPFTLDAAFVKYVDGVVAQSLRQGLVTVINLHHYDQLYTDPDKHMARFIALWKQIAEHFRDRPDRLYFELLNEPNSKLNAERWNRTIPQLLEVIRPSNPERMVIVGPGQWNQINLLDKLSLPENDRRLIVTIHYYSPFEFTHQGASWARGSDKWIGRKWTSSEKELQNLGKDFAKAAAWAKKNARPIYLGEFGSYEAADMESRSRWTHAVAHEAEKHGWSWAYWEFAAGFGLYDRNASAWRRPLLDALLKQN